MGEDLASVFKALSNPHRLRIFRALSRCSVGSGRNVQDIASDLHGLALSTVSHHIKELRQAGLVHCQRDGKQVLCTIAPGALGRLREFLLAMSSPENKE